MTTAKNKKIWWTISLTVFVLLLVVIVSLNYWAKARVRQELEQLSGRKLNGIYTLSFGKTYVDIWSGEFQATEISLQSDTAVWNKLRAQQPDSLPALVSLTAQTIHIKHFNLLRYFSGKTAAMRSVVLDNPQLTIISTRDTVKADVSLKDRLLKLPESISSFASSLKIKHISVNNASVHLRTIRAPGDTLKQDLEQADLYVKDLNTENGSNEVTYCKEIEIRARHIATIFNVGTQKISFDDFKMSKNGKHVSLHNFQVDPQRSEQQFFKDIGVRKAYFTIKSPEITLEGFDLNRWLTNDYLYAHSMHVQEPMLHFTINKFLPLPFRKLLPHELVAKVKGVFNVEELIVKDGQIAITNRVDGKDFSITFDHSYITANNFTNDSLLMDDSHPLAIWAEARFMDQAPVKLQLNLPLRSRTLDADYTASVDGLSLAVLNPVISHKHLSITSGYMRSAEIKSVIRNGVATGKVVMQYQGLEIELMKKDTGKTRKLASKIANILINEDNTKADPSTFITGNISLTRNKQEEFFAFMWHSIQTGLMETILPAYEKLNMKPGRT